MTKTITQAQAEVIEALYDMGCGDGPDGLSITPETAFPERDNRDNGCRRTMRKLAALGLLTIDSLGQYHATPAARLAFKAWRRADDERFFAAARAARKAGAR